LLTFLLTQGYAILDNATMPVIGDPETMNNTLIHGEADDNSGTFPIQSERMYQAI
jgi:hypothetical protein